MRREDLREKNIVIGCRVRVLVVDELSGGTVIDIREVGTRNDWEVVVQQDDGIVHGWRYIGNINREDDDPTGLEILLE